MPSTPEEQLQKAHSRADRLHGQLFAAESKTVELSQALLRFHLYIASTNQVEQYLAFIANQPAAPHRLIDPFTAIHAFLGAVDRMRENGVAIHGLLEAAEYMGKQVVHGQSVTGDGSKSC